MVELYSIFKHYKKQYNLKTQLNIGNQLSTCYNTKDDTINISPMQISNCVVGMTNCFRLTGDICFRNKSIISLLHELKHAIDWTTNRKNCLKEDANIDVKLYFTNPKYHDSQPFEIRANKFMEEELNKWVDIKC